MKKSRFTEEQIAFALRQSENGTATRCRFRCNVQPHRVGTRRMTGIVRTREPCSAALRKTTQSPATARDCERWALLDSNQ